MPADFGTVPSTGTEEPKSIFPFLDLPRELSDKIYEQATEDPSYLMSGPGNDHRMVLVMIKLPLPQMMLVNRQIRQEYAKILNIKTTLEICDGDGPLTLPDFDSDSKPFKNISNAVVRVTNKCRGCMRGKPTCPVASCIYLIRRLIEEVVNRLPGLKTIKASLSIPYSPSFPAKPWPETSHYDIKEIRDQLDDLTKVEQVSEIEVYYLEKGKILPELEPTHMWVTWTRKHGWKAPEKDSRPARDPGN